MQDVLHEDGEIHSVKTASHVSLAAAKIYRSPLKETGILHVISVWRHPNGDYRVLRINPQTPQCIHDLFALNLTRARADAIITTGKILRLEPDLRPEIGGPAHMPEALRRWRRQVLGKKQPPLFLVLTSGRSIDLQQPFFRGATKPIFFTDAEGQRFLARSAGAAGLEVVSSSNPGLRAAISFLQHKRQARTIAIEAGPLSSVDLYQPPLAVDELLLTVYRESRIPESVVGGRFLHRQTIKRLFTLPCRAFDVGASSGNWTLKRFVASGGL